jgi:acyl-CoA thioesterase-1
MLRMFTISWFALFIVFSPASADEVIRIFAFGDSLTAGYGLAPQDGFTAQLETHLKDQGLNAQVINAGVSGDTSSGGRARLAWVVDALEAKPDLAILELGANDGLRGIDPAVTRKNLDAMIEAFQARDIPILLTGMLAPPNLGPDYESEFNTMYPELAKDHDVALYPFFLDGVAANPELNQEDGIHPNEHGVDIIVERLTPYILRSLGKSGHISN